ncbi:MAG: peptide chain release factor N(5)-glutamine methyltransferase [Chloroflexota bacterium]|nr:peptide chain release factor N(5)-glutamine methyltransferase [Chloroflexota bacterium]
MTTTIGSALADATIRLRASGSPSARLDAELLVAHVTECERSWVIAHPEAALDEAGAFATAVERRAAGEPIAYIRGFKEWRSLRIKTDARALIPRPETELLADAAIIEIEGRLAGNAAPVVAWEVATGSGAVAVSLALHFRAALDLGRLLMIATDISPDALDLAAVNFADHGVDRHVWTVRADLLEPAGGTLPRPHVIVTNLPYVPTVEVDAPDASLAFEPRLALDGGPDGLALLRRLLNEVPGRASQSASVLLEIGAGQAGDVRALAPAGASVSMVPDLAGIDRVARVQMPD